MNLCIFAPETLQQTYSYNLESTEQSAVKPVKLMNFIHFYRIQIYNDRQKTTYYKERRQEVHHKKYG